MSDGHEEVLPQLPATQLMGQAELCGDLGEGSLKIVVCSSRHSAIIRLDRPLRTVQRPA